jgi:hypothetical protein
MRLSEHYLEFVSFFKGASRSFIFIFLFERAAKKFKSHLCIPESTDIILETLKKNSSHDPVPFPLISLLSCWS